MTERAPDRLLRIGEVAQIIGLSHRSIYRMIRAQTFPQPYKPGGYASRWSESEIQAWRESQRQSPKAA